tara:strand:- start:10790 stop:11473 length:684 start_codon:yes stop_codon:yes gene_type:complete
LIKKILVVAAHPDDEVLGCGATLLRFKKQGCKIKVIFLTDGESSRLGAKNLDELVSKRKKNAEQVSNKAKFHLPVFGKFKDNQLDKEPLLHVTQFIEKEIMKFKPDTIFTHFENDLNVDHQKAFNAVNIACRPLSKSFVKNIYCFEIPSNTNLILTRKNKKLYNPNFFVDINNFINKKISLLKIYKSELRKWPHTRSLKGIKNLAEYRGSQVGLKFAEAFITIREIY